MHKIPSTPHGSTMPLSINGGELTSLHSGLLKEGMILTAKVLSSSAMGMVKLQIGDIPLSALTQAELKRGEVVNLKVVKVGQKLQFQIILSPEVIDGGKRDIKQDTAPVVSPTHARAAHPAGVIKILSLNPKIAFDSGTFLEARVLSTSKAGIIRLQIGHVTIEGTSTSHFKPGQRLTVQVAGDQLQPQLKTISVVEAKGIAPANPPSSSKPDNALIRPLLSESLPELLKGLRKGELIQARVVANNLEGQLSLKIGDSVIKVTTELQTLKEQTLYLKVIKGGEQPVLEQVSRKEFNHQLTLGAYRQLLPRQQSLISGVQKLLDVNRSQVKDLPPMIKESVALLVKQLATPDKLTLPTELRQTLLNSGLYAESKLVAGMPMRADFKIGISQLISLIRASFSNRQRDAKRDISGVNTISKAAQKTAQMVPLGILDELLRSSDSAVARIQMQQLVSLPQEDSGQQSWHFELPILNGDKLEQVSIVIDRGTGGDEENDPNPWSITLQMNLTPLGPMRVQLMLQERNISTTFWAEEQHTLSLLNRNIPTLKSAFEKAGMEVSGLRVLHGTIKVEEENIPEDLSLVNVRV